MCPKLPRASFQPTPDIISPKSEEKAGVVNSAGARTRQQGPTCLFISSLPTTEGFNIADTMRLGLCSRTPSYAEIAYLEDWLTRVFCRSNVMRIPPLRSCIVISKVDGTTLEQNVSPCGDCRLRHARRL